MRNTDPAFEAVLTKPHLVKQLAPGTQINRTQWQEQNKTKRHMELCIVKLASETGREKMNYSPVDMEPTR